MCFVPLSSFRCGEPEEEGDQEEEHKKYEDDYVWFESDVSSESEGADEDDKIHGIQLEDPRLM